jgi:Right handed beta helix region
MLVVKIPLIKGPGHRGLLYGAIGAVLIIVIAFVVISLNVHHNTASNAGPEEPVPGPAGKATLVCGQPILRSPFNYDGSARSYTSGTPGLPTYGKPGSDFPEDTAGVILPTGTHSYPSYQLSPHTVYYLLPGIHVGSFQADTGDAFVGGFAGGTPTTLTGNYPGASGIGWAIDSNSSIGDQAGVTIEYLTVQKFKPAGNSAAINPDSNTGWNIRYNTITLNVPGAGVILGANAVLQDNCLTLNGQYGFQSVAPNPWGHDSLTGGPYNVTVEGNEISYNDTCDFEGLLDNSSIGWSKHNPVPPQYRNSHCGPVTPDGDQGGFKLWLTDGVTIKDNYIHNNWGPGGWADTDNANTTYTGNTITDNDGEAIIEEISYNFSITDNYIAGNTWVGGVSNPDFPPPAIYISESGSNTASGGVPACPEASCGDQSSYPTQSVISGNTLVNNGGNFLLWQDSNRFCGDGYDSVCTLVTGGSAGRFTLAGCKANLPSASVNPATYVGNLTGSPRRDWWDGCLWKTENVSITRNVIDFDPAKITDCNKTDWPACGAGGIFSEYGSTAPYKTPLLLTQLAFFQHDSWSDNTYNGPSTFYAWNQGNGDNPVSWAEWTGSVSKGDKCSSPSEHSSGYCTGPFGQDAGSTYTP